ncbi:hypothetical protein [Tabrizicola sp. M-4]
MGRVCPVGWRRSGKHVFPPGAAEVE